MVDYLASHIMLKRVYELNIIETSMLKKIYEYYYYRISKFYKNMGSKTPCTQASFLIFSAINLIVLSLISIVLMIVDVRWEDNWVYLISIIVVLSGTFTANENKYKKLEDRYKNESHTTLKGWLIFLSLIGSLIVWMITCWIMYR